MDSKNFKSINIPNEMTTFLVETEIACLVATTDGIDFDFSTVQKQSSSKTLGDLMDNVVRVVFSGLS
jgi:hypothetical protein